jgi:two-component system sensor histidine kinase CpxA
MLDKRLIHRAIENILRNALRYSPEEQVVTISLYQGTRKNSVFIDIEDNGPGVPEDQLTKIFSPFYRVDTARQKKTGGYGLGLAIAKKAIQLHHGKIHATNRREGGLLVRIILPKNP